NRLFKVEKLLIKFITKYEDYTSKGSLNLQLKKLSLDLKSFKSDKYEKKAFSYFDYLEWIESKIEKN
ncbi:MAG: hypothetical protein P8Q14_00335, partial [Vicingaceae bacterium]|nr:hypothetical protein [Vicingaceae bacterium]